MSNFPAFYVHNRDKPNFNRTTRSSCARTCGMKYSNIFFMKYFLCGPLSYLRILMISSFPTYLQVLIYQCNVMSCDRCSAAGQISSIITRPTVPHSVDFVAIYQILAVIGNVSTLLFEGMLMSKHWLIKKSHYCFFKGIY